jgi:hypothetical protein
VGAAGPAEGDEQAGTGGAGEARPAQGPAARPDRWHGAPGRVGPAARPDRRRGAPGGVGSAWRRATEEGALLNDGRWHQRQRVTEGRGGVQRAGPAPRG